VARSARILVTGATGNLGMKAVGALHDAGVHDLIEFGRDAGDRPDVVDVDLAVQYDSWAGHFAGVDVVLHLAADHRATAAWDDVVHHNLDVSLNVFRAAAAAGVDRIVFAASNWILGGYRFTDVPLGPATTPRPVNPYGAAKLFVERLGFDLAARTGIAFLSLRIGYCQPGDNVPGPHMAFGRWGQEMWLSNDDWGQAVVQACRAPFTGAASLNVMSRNRGMRWSLDETAAAIGYSPRSHHRPVMTAVGRTTDALARVRDRIVPGCSPAPLVGARW
jgi:nucleoside-diphosphate-sugar epimerase